MRQKKPLKWFKFWFHSIKNWASKHFYSASFHFISYGVYTLVGLRAFMSPILFGKIKRNRLSIYPSRRVEEIDWWVMITDRLKDGLWCQNDLHLTLGRKLKPVRCCNEHVLNCYVFWEAIDTCIFIYASSENKNMQLKGIEIYMIYITWLKWFIFFFLNRTNSLTNKNRNKGNTAKQKETAEKESLFSSKN